MSKKYLLPTLILLSVLLSGCQFIDQLKSLVSTKQEKAVDGAWLKQGNTYSTTVKYFSPGGEEVNDFTIVLEKGVITSVEMKVYTQIDASIRYQNQFAEELPKIIVGKKLSDITTLDKISGASLTTDAFNQALLRLKKQV